MPCGDMRDLVCHQTSQFSLAVDFHDQSLIDIKEATGQGKNLEARRIDYFDGKSYLGVRVTHDLLGKPANVFIYIHIGNEFRATIDCRGQGLSQSALLLLRVKIYAVSNAPLPYAVNVVLVRFLWCLFRDGGTAGCRRCGIRGILSAGYGANI